MAVWHGGNLARFVYITLGAIRADPIEHLPRSLYGECCSLGLGDPRHGRRVLLFDSLLLFVEYPSRVGSERVGFVSNDGFSGLHLRRPPNGDRNAAAPSDRSDCVCLRPEGRWRLTARPTRSL